MSKKNAAELLKFIAEWMEREGTNATSLEDSAHVYRGALSKMKPPTSAVPDPDVLRRLADGMGVARGELFRRAYALSDADMIVGVRLTAEREEVLGLYDRLTAEQRAALIQVGRAMLGPAIPLRLSQGQGPTRRRRASGGG